ncbi:hypothetical protein B0H11DRAFT_2240736 [Mycena galericulata]|nr:hypothetical protein B0H11DRAFT_2240736 [Mycena galericulata]
MSCQAEDSDGEECDCEAFAPKASQPKTCRLCLHRKKHHPDSDETISSILLQVKKEHEGEPGTKMFDQISQAKRESLDGMRPKSVKKLSKKANINPFLLRQPSFTTHLQDLKLTNGSKKVKKYREPASVATFKLDGFAILGDGLIQNDERTRLELADSTTPSTAFIQELINQGLAVRSENEIEIPLSASYEDVVDILSDHLPGPMAYFQHLGLSVFRDPNGVKIVSAPGWVLLTRVKQRLEVVQVVNPTGKDFHTHRGAKSAAENRFIFLSSRVPIPRNERAAWRTTDSLAFAVSKSDSDDETGDTPKNSKNRKGKGKKRPTSFEPEQSEEEFLPMTQPTLKKRKLHARSDADLPSIYTDEIAREIAFVPAHASNTITQASQTNAVAGPSTNASNAVLGSSTPIDLTASLSRSPSPWPWARATTPEPSITIDPTYSDPVEYTYSTGPRVLPDRKFF